MRIVRVVCPTRTRDGRCGLESTWCGYPPCVAPSCTFGKAEVREVVDRAVIMAIKPKYVDAILDGRKKYEFRKRMFRRKVDEVLVYATKPVGKIVCMFSVGNVVRDEPGELWRRFGSDAGMTEEEFFRYFDGCKQGVAIEIKDVAEINVNDVNYISNFVPPRSWIYVKR